MATVRSTRNGRWLFLTAASRPRHVGRAEGACAFSGYLAVSVLRLGGHTLGHLGSGTLGTGPDVQVFLWGLRWWPYAVQHGVNPLLTHLVWPPDGADILWTTTVPALSLVAAPVTIGFGPTVSWNLLCILAPAGSAWATWWLCRELGARRGPALLGGALFGFSSFEIAAGLAHLQLTMNLLIPLAFVLVVRHAAGRTTSRELAGGMAVITIVQFLIAPELLATLVLMLMLSAAAALVVAPRERPSIARTASWGLIGIGLGCGALSPLLVWMLTHAPAVHNASVGYAADLVNLAVPSRITALGGGWSTSIAAHYPGNVAEQGAYLGEPLLAILAWFALGGRAKPSSRLLTATLLMGVILSLGAHLTVDGRRLAPLPWAIVSHLPLLSNAMPDRFALYTALTAAVIAALWLSEPDRPNVARWILAAAAALTLVPSAASVQWQRTAPAITSGVLAHALDHQRVLSLPFYDPHDRSLQAQADGGMRFSLIDSWMQLKPSGYRRYADLRTVKLGAAVLPTTLRSTADIRSFERQLCRAGITRLVSWSPHGNPAIPLHWGLHDATGVTVYEVPRCPAA